jgi:hypothetical protein
VKKYKMKCLNCDLPCKVKFCSTKCQRELSYRDFLNVWLSGADVKTSKGMSISSHIRRYLFEKFESRCARCSWAEVNPVSKVVPLEVEHIDGNSQNNSPDNLTLLCPNCHSLTPTFRALNKGNGRHGRMARYREGKSY